MNNLMSLGECLFTVVLFFVVAFGIARSWAPYSTAAVAKLMRSIYSPHMLSKSTVTSDELELVPSTGIGTGTEVVAEVATDEDIQLPNAVPLSRHMETVDIIVLLASQKKGDAYRYSASKIYALTGGNHNDVLELIRQVQGREKRNGKRTTEPTE